MPYNPIKHHRRSIRLRGHDYTGRGVYFITICVQNRECLLGNVINRKMRLNEFGEIALAHWNQIPIHFPGVELDAFVVMPNHVHGVVIFTDNVGAGQSRPYVSTPTGKPALGHVIRHFKYQSTMQINDKRGMPPIPIWQRNYFERIIRNSDEQERIRRYIIENPERWDEDSQNLFRFAD